MTTKYTAEDLQMDLLDAIAEAERMDARAKNLLCKGWADGIKNELGVYVKNVREYSAKGTHNCRVVLSLVKDGCMVYGDVDYDAGTYGASRQLTEQSHINFMTTEDKYQATCGILLKVNAIVLDDPNIDDELLNEMTSCASRACSMAEKEL